MIPTARALMRATLRIGLSSLGEVIGRAVNVILPFALFAVHGIGSDTDRFFLALAVAFFIHGTIANAVTSGLVPQAVGDAEPKSLASYAVAAALIGAIAGGIAGTVAAPSPAGAVPAVVALAVAALAGAGLLAAPAVAILNAEHRYAAPGLTWGLRIVPIALYVAWAPEVPALHWLLAGLAAADTARVVLLCRIARGRLHFGKGARLRFPPSALHLMLGSALAGLVPLALRAIAATGAPGSVSQYEAADRLFGAVASLATIGVGNVALVYLARLKGSPEEQAGWRLMLRTSLGWSALWLAASLALWAAFPLVSPQLGVPQGAASDVVRNAFLALSLGLPGFIVTGMLGRRMLTIGAAAAFVPVTSVGVAFSIGSAWLLFSALGPVGLAAAVGASQYVVASLMYVVVRQGGRGAHPRAV